MMHNPLKRPILEILQHAHEPLKEYDLHSTLGGTAFAQFIEQCSTELSLFRKHFLVMNALYELHEELLPEGLYLQISALHIQLIAISETPSESQALSTDTGFSRLNDYYRNWENFANTDSQEVNSLLQQFWQHFLAEDEKAQALDCLQLPEDASWSDIQQQYRQLCQRHHPDKGGETLVFIEIREAYDNLKCLYQRK